MVKIKTDVWENTDAQFWREYLSKFTWLMGFIALINIATGIYTKSVYIIILNMIPFLLAIVIMYSKNKWEVGKV